MDVPQTIDDAESAVAATDADAIVVEVANLNLEVWFYDDDGLRSVTYDRDIERAVESSPDSVERSDAFERASGVREADLSDFPGDLDDPITPVEAAMQLIAVE